MTGPFKDQLIFCQGNHTRLKKTIGNRRSNCIHQAIAKVKNNVHVKCFKQGAQHALRQRPFWPAARHDEPVPFRRPDRLHQRLMTPGIEAGPFMDVQIGKEISAEIFLQERGYVAERRDVYRHGSLNSDGQEIRVSVQLLTGRRGSIRINEEHATRRAIQQRSVLVQKRPRRHGVIEQQRRSV